MDIKSWIFGKENKLYGITIAFLFLLGISIGFRLNLDADDLQRSESGTLAQEKITLLCLGVDKDVVMSDRHPETNSIGQADAIFVVSIDKANNQVDIVSVPRDTMVTMTKYNHKMQFLGVEEDQICLQYAYADGMEESCKLMVNCVKELFPNTKIDGYVSINFEAFTVINDKIGGIEVTVNDPLIALHMGVPVGTTMVLTGDNAMLYLRIRDKEVMGSAYTRMDRIKEYITKIIPKGVAEITKDPGLVVDIYQALEEHMITNISIKELVALVPELTDGTLENINFYTLEGEIAMGEDGFEEFYPNQTQLEELDKLLQ